MYTLAIILQSSSALSHILVLSIYGSKAKYRMGGVPPSLALSKSYLVVGLETPFCELYRLIPALQIWLYVTMSGGYESYRAQDFQHKTLQEQRIPY